MSADNPLVDSSFVTANHLQKSRNFRIPEDRTCPFCGKEYDDDGRARAAFLRHVAACDDREQRTLTEFGGGR